MVWCPNINNKPKNLKNNIFSSVYFNSSSSILSISDIDTSSLKNIKIQFYPSQEQIHKLNHWFELVSQVYNEINEFIKYIICKPKYYLGKNNIIECSYTFINDKKFINKMLRWQTIRDMFSNEISDFNNDSNNIYRHTLDYSIKLCIEMYKSAYSNYEAGIIKQFNIKNLKPDRVRKNFVIEPCNFSKTINGFCVKHFGLIKSAKELNEIKIKHNVIVQFNTYTNKYYFLIPIDEKINRTMYRSSKCGIDIGVRTFQTVYSNNKCYEIGKGITKLIDKYNKKLDSIKARKSKGELSTRKANKAKKKYQMKLTNLIDDLHKKTASMLLRNFDVINIGKVSIKSMISKLKGNIREKTKRRLVALKHYKFREYLLLNASKFDTKVNLVSEFMTSQTCHKCGSRYKIGSSEEYNCIKCGLKTGRDINASINIYKI
jgi:transposase